MEISKYENSPIREAIFDVRIKFETLPEQSTISEFVNSINNDEYIKNEVLTKGEFLFEFKVGEKSNFNSKSEENGIRVTSKDGSKVIQFRKDGFTFSKLRPYNGWEVFSSEAKSLLNEYVEAMEGNLHIERLALRYINAFSIPLDKFTLEEYFKTSPTLSKDMPQNLVNFFMRAIVKDDYTNTFAIINQTIEDSKKEGVTNVIFDIDAFQANLKLALEDEEFDEILSQIRSLRTKVFEGSMTEKTRKLIQ